MGDEVTPIEAVAQISAVPTILRVITEMTGLRLSMIAHVTENEWTCCAVNDQLGFGRTVGCQLDVATTLCSEVRQARSPIVISHASTDAVYCNHLAPKRYKFESYISVPIFLRNGDYFGNVCALDSEPVDLSAPRTLATLQLFAELVGLQLDAEARQRAACDALLDARATSGLREQFIAVLGHDLRTPVQAISIGATALAHSELPPAATSIVQRISRSADRITQLVHDVLDLARGRLGGGIPIAVHSIDDVGDVLRQVVDELRSVHPDRVIEVHTACTAPVQADPGRLAQLLQNLLGNALVHSPPSARVAVRIVTDERDLVLVVTNGGPPIPADVAARMFEPYHRGTTTNPQGLGLGLYIAAQIVHSHHGTIDVASNSDATTITCRLPRAQT